MRDLEALATEMYAMLKVLEGSLSNLDKLVQRIHWVLNDYEREMKGKEEK